MFSHNRGGIQGESEGPSIMEQEFTGNHREQYGRLGSSQRLLDNLSPRGKLPKFSFRSPVKQEPPEFRSTGKVVFQPCRQSALRGRQQRVQQLRACLSERKLKAESRFGELQGRLDQLKREYASQSHTLRVITATIADNL